MAADPTEARKRIRTIAKILFKGLMRGISRKSKRIQAEST